MLLHLFYSIPLLLFSISIQAMQLITTHPKYIPGSIELPYLHVSDEQIKHFDTLHDAIQDTDNKEHYSPFIAFDYIQRSIEQSHNIPIGPCHLRKAYSIMQDNNFYTSDNPNCVHDIWTQYMPSIHDASLYRFKGIFYG